MNGTEWAKALLDNLPKGQNDTDPFEVYDNGQSQGFFERQVPDRKRPGTDRVSAGFVKFAGDRFKPLLRREVEQAKISHQFLIRERRQTNSNAR